MSDFISILTHARKFKAAVRELELTELCSFQEKLTALIAVSYTHLTLPTICSV